MKFILSPAEPWGHHISWGYTHETRVLLMPCMLSTKLYSPAQLCIRAHSYAQGLRLSKPPTCGVDIHNTAYTTMNTSITTIINQNQSYHPCSTFEKGLSRSCFQKVTRQKYNWPLGRLSHVTSNKLIFEKNNLHFYSYFDTYKATHPDSEAIWLNP